MTDPGTFIDSAALLAAVAIMSLAALRAWRGWLDLRRIQLVGGRSEPSAPSPAARIELADLKERVRRLEAIANGVES